MGTRVYPGDSPPSAVRGWLTRLRGLFTFNRHVSRDGKHEIEDAKAYRHYQRDRSVHRSQSRHRNHSFLHPRHRCRPTYHGAHFRFWGFITRKREYMMRGMQMREEAERERRRERHRRQRRLAEEGTAIRMGAKTLIRPRREHHRRHHHSRHGHGQEGFAPIVATPSEYHTAYGGEVVPVMHSSSRHHRSSSGGHGIPVVRTISSRHGRAHSEMAVPAGFVASSQGYVGPPISRASSSRYGPGVVPVMRSSSRHGSSRYGDAGIVRTTSSRHGHSRNPTEVYVTA